MIFLGRDSQVRLCLLSRVPRDAAGHRLVPDDLWILRDRGRHRRGRAGRHGTRTGACRVRCGRILGRRCPPKRGRTSKRQSQPKSRDSADPICWNLKHASASRRSVGDGARAYAIQIDLTVASHLSGGTRKCEVGKRSQRARLDAVAHAAAAAARASRPARAASRGRRGARTEIRNDLARRPH